MIRTEPLELMSAEVCSFEFSLECSSLLLKMFCKVGIGSGYSASIQFRISEHDVKMAESLRSCDDNMTEHFMKNKCRTLRAPTIIDFMYLILSELYTLIV